MIETLAVVSIVSALGALHKWYYRHGNHLTLNDTQAHIDYTPEGYGC